LVAINANTGDIAWQVPLGINETLPAGKQNVGSPGFGGPMVTAGGLVFIGATTDSRFRAFESKTGKELWSTKLDYNVQAIPMTYQGKDGKQYVAVTAAVGGQRGANNESLVVFTLEK
jgi:quinoprotein glucose dehydrogenase